jgi:hypothetical protein
MFSRPPQVDPRGGARFDDPVGVDEGAVDRYVFMACDLGCQQCGVQGGCGGGEDVDPLVQIVVGSGQPDRVVESQLLHTGVVDEPPQHHNRLVR